MPELPEVEVIRRQASQEVVGASITRVKFGVNGNALKLMVKRPIEEILPGKKIQDVVRFAKTFAFALEGDWYLTIRLLMNGRLIVRPSSADEDYLRVSFYLSDGRVMNFSDRGNFADIQLLTQSEWIEFKTTFGPEAHEEGLTAGTLLERLKAHPESTIKEALLNQKIISGIGNIHADEILHRAKLNPRTKPDQIGEELANQILDASKKEFAEAISHGGTTIDSYLDFYGNSGAHQNYFLVYSREGKPCKNCGTPITMEEMKSRRTFWCKVCQPESQLSLF